MPVKYIEILNSKGNYTPTEEVAYTYSYYQDKQTDFFHTNRFTFNSGMDDLKEFLQYFEIDIEDINWEIDEDSRKYGFFVNVEKLDDNTLDISITSHDIMKFEERCFQEHFKQIIKTKGEPNK